MKERIFNLNNLVLFLIGSCFYGMIEVGFRGHTHYSMLLAGGICFMLLHRINRMNVGFAVKCLIGSAGITAVEFVFGVVFNIMLDMNVWDYSAVPLNLLGQICFPFTAAWFVISAAAFVIDTKLSRTLATAPFML